MAARGGGPATRDAGGHGADADHSWDRMVDGGARPQSAHPRLGRTLSKRSTRRKRRSRPVTAGSRRSMGTSGSVSSGRHSVKRGGWDDEPGFQIPGVSTVFNRATRDGLRRTHSAHFGTSPRWRAPKDASTKGVRPTSAQLARVDSTLGHQLLSHLRSGSFAHMSSSTRDEYTRAMGADTNDTVGPGSYTVPGSLGKQPLSSHRTFPRMDFTTAKRKDDSMARRSPGPVYKANNFIGVDRPVGGRRQPSFRFTTAARKAQVKPQSPGPIYTPKMDAFCTNLGRRGPAVGFTKAKRFGPGGAY